MEEVVLWGINANSLTCDCPDGPRCRSPGKHPAPNEYPNANRGVRTDGFLVVDVDRREDKNGVAELAKLTAAYGALPRTRTVRTPSGGLHLYYALPTGSKVRCSASKLAPGVDVRGDGGYVVAPGSRHVSGGIYSVVVDAPPALASPWLLERVAATARASANVDLERPAFPAATAEILDEARAALAKHGPAIEGQGGDAKTYVAMAILSHDFALSEDEAWPIACAWNETCQPPWSAPDLRSKLRGAAKYGTGEFGSKRTLDVTATVRKLIADSVGQVDPMPLIDAARRVFARISDPALHALLTNELCAATGLKRKDLNLPRAPDPEALRRREAFDAGAVEIVDTNAPFATAQHYLRASADAEGYPATVRFQDTYFKSDNTKTRYLEQPESAEIAKLYKYLENKTDAATGATNRPDRNQVEEVNHALRAAARIDVPVVPSWIGPAREHSADEILAFTNGLLHARTRQHLDATRAWFGFNAVDFAYDPHAPRPVAWLQFLAQLWPNDTESVETLGEIFGLSLTGDTSFQKLFLLIGPKRSGKGTLARVLTSLVGSENVAAPTLNGLGQHFGLESLISKQLAVISDARLGSRTDISAVTENLLRISGEDTISVPRKHRSDWTARLRTRFLIISNELPHLLDQSGALASRFIVLRLTRSFFGEEDRSLTQRLLQELPGILLWALDGLDRLRERGHFRQPTSAIEMVTQLENLASPIKAFISECCVVAPGASVSVEQVYSAWCQWTAEQGRDQPGSKPMFGRNLGAAFPGVVVKQRRAGDGVHRFYEGLGLKGGVT